jgi:23S rRNA maturation-related 3'-5' exoribonuclease YhaM
MTREAFLLHYADQIDSKMDALRRIQLEAAPGERWKFVRLLNRYLSVAPKDPSDDANPGT